MTVLLDAAARVLLGFVPVLGLLVALRAFDAHKLLRLRDVVRTLALGAACALVALPTNKALEEILGFETQAVSRYVAPLVEEALKAGVLVWLIRGHRVGFLVDAGIHGFAAGAGFALAENFQFWLSRPDAGLAVWFVRGCGTAVMHAGTGGVIALGAKAGWDRAVAPRAVHWAPGFAIAVALHSAFNHFPVSPLLSTAGIAVVAPPLVAAVFQRAVRGTQHRLRRGFDADTELLGLILTGAISHSPVGEYLANLRERFRPEVVVDLLCYLRIRLELSLHVKGLLLLREAGFDPEPDPQIGAKLTELEFLEKSIGATGRLALAPFLRGGPEEIWQNGLLRGGGR